MMSILTELSSIHERVRDQNTALKTRRPRTESQRLSCDALSSLKPRQQLYTINASEDGVRADAPATPAQVFAHALIASLKSREMLVGCDQSVTTVHSDSHQEFLAPSSNVLCAMDLSPSLVDHEACQPSSLDRSCVQDVASRASSNEPKHAGPRVVGRSFKYLTAMLIRMAGYCSGYSPRRTRAARRA
jgi:hypothetical protein